MEGFLKDGIGEAPHSVFPKWRKVLAKQGHGFIRASGENQTAKATNLDVAQSDTSPVLKDTPEPRFERDDQTCILHLSQVIVIYQRARNADPNLDAAGRRFLQLRFRRLHRLAGFCLLRDGRIVGVDFW